MISLLPRFAIAIGLYAGHCCSAVYAVEGELILPVQDSSNVVFEMLDDRADVNPSQVFQVFQVFVGGRDTCCEGKTPVAGRYSIYGRTVTFIPAFDFVEGQIYTVKIPDRSASKKGIHYFDEFTIKRSIDNASPEVVAVFPSGTDIPENTLRFYIHFSSPMQPHVSSEYIKLLDATGTPDRSAFMAFKQELWSEDRKRLTLLMDPGRIKRGVARNLSMGPALEEGKRYSIVVEEGWLTANDGKKLPRFETTFTVSKALRTKPNPEFWTITSPKYSSSDPLLIEFDRPLDYELLHSKISVFSEDGRPIPGEIKIDKQEKRWRFYRDGVWSNSQIRIAVDAQLEDVAGNNFIELLDHSVDTEMPLSNQKIFTVDLELSPIEGTIISTD